MLYFQAELSLLMMDEDDVEKRQHFSLQKLLKTDKSKKKRKKRDNDEDITSTEDTFKVFHCTVLCFGHSEVKKHTN